MNKYEKLFKAYKANKLEKFNEIFSTLNFSDLKFMMEKYPKMTTKYVLFKPFQAYWDKKIKVNKFMVTMMATALRDPEVSNKVFENDRNLHKNLNENREAILLFLAVLHFGQTDEWVRLEAAIVLGILAKFDHYIQEMHDLLDFNKALSQENANALAKHIINDDKLRNEIITSLYDLHKFIHLFPFTISTLVPRLLADQAKYEQLVQSVHDLSSLIESVSYFADAPEKLEQLIPKVFQLNEHEFQRLIHSLDDIKYLNKKHPSSTAYLAKYVLNHQLEYERLVKNNHDRKQLASLIMHASPSLLAKEYKHHLSAEIIESAKKTLAKKTSSYDPKLLADNKHKIKKLSQDSEENAVEKTKSSSLQR